MIGTALGNYRITQKLGQGGVGDVWKAMDLTLDRDVALKVLRPELAAIPEVVARFRAEALVLARLNHPNVATIHGFHMQGDSPFMVMEYVFGQTLEAIVRGFGPMRSQRAMPIFMQVCNAVEHAHGHGIVHRDLKGSNVMVSQVGVVKVLDFGIARVVGSAHLTQGPRGVGTPAWMAPEQVRGEEADVRTDVYALGLLLYWLVTARLPFEFENTFELQRAHLEATPRSPRSFAPDLPEAIEKLILRALAKDRSERFGDVALLRAALGEVFVPSLTIPTSDAFDQVVSGILEAETHPIGIPVPLRSSGPQQAVSHVGLARARWPLAIAALVLLLALIGVSRLLLRDEAPSHTGPTLSTGESPSLEEKRGADPGAPDASPRPRKVERKKPPARADKDDRWVIRRR